MSPRRRARLSAFALLAALAACAGPDRAAEEAEARAIQAKVLSQPRKSVGERAPVPRIRQETVGRGGGNPTRGALGMPDRFTGGSR